MMMQVLREIGSPWPGELDFSPIMRWKAWTASGSIIAVWDCAEFSDVANPFIRVIDATSGKVTKTMTLPDIPGQEHQPWRRMQGKFALEAFALSPDEHVLAIACEDYDTILAALFWLVDLVSGEVIFKVAECGDGIMELVFSADGQVVGAQCMREHPDANLALLHVGDCFPVAHHSRKRLLMPQAQCICPAMVQDCTFPG